MGNPEKIEIEGLKAIHKLCKFGADHNMEGCTFTEIIERMFSKIEQMKTQVNTLDEMLLNQGEALAQAKAQAVPDLGELQERIAGHQYYHDEHGHMIVDMDDVVKEISGFDSWKAQAVPEGFVLVSKDTLNKALNPNDYDEAVCSANELLAVIEAQQPSSTSGCPDEP